MNLFRSEEHARNWTGFRAEAAAGLRPLADIQALWTAERYSQRLNGHYVSSVASYWPAFLEVLNRVTGGDPFWQR